MTSLQVLLDLLVRNNGLPAGTANAAENWWRHSHSDGEDFVPFLVRNNVLTAAAPIVLELLEAGTIAEADPNRVFSSNAAQILIEYSLQSPPASTSVSVAELPIPLHDESPAPDDEASGQGSFSPPAAVTSEIEATQSTPSEILSPTSQMVSPSSNLGSNSGMSLSTEGAMLPTIGSTLGRCVLMEKIGEGGAGIVFRALHKSLNIPVAVKVFRRSALEAGSAGYAQFKAEAQLLAQLNHPNVVRVWDFEDDPQYPYLVLEFVEGLTLNELIAHSGRLQADRAINMIEQVASALRAANQLGIVHRDVKPANILITRAGEAKLADLGLAVVISGKLADTHGGQSLGGLAGTAAYMSPEQAVGSKSLDHRSDIYSLGATFYHVITGELPFPGKRMAEVLMKHIKEMPKPPHIVVPGLDQMVSEVILTMMAKNPAERYETYDELLDNLKLLRDRVNMKPVSVSPMSRSVQTPASPVAQQPANPPSSHKADPMVLESQQSPSRPGTGGSGSRMSSVWSTIRSSFVRKKPDDPNETV